MYIKKPMADGIRLKKHHGQNFLHDHSVVRDMLGAVNLKNRSVFEIGCGAGFLTKQILANDITRLWVFEIDPEWADKVATEFACPKLTVNTSNILDIDFEIFKEHSPWLLLSNLPYHVTFPILRKMQKNRDTVTEGVIMVQEEVAQKIVKDSGRGYGYISLFYQYYYEWKLLTKVPPTAFYPAPKVFSRLMHFKVRPDVAPIIDEDEFWKFIKLCFIQPRRTLRNNLSQTHLDISRLSEDTLKLRAQQMNFSELFELWQFIKNV